MGLEHVIQDRNSKEISSLESTSAIIDTGIVQVHTEPSNYNPSDLDAKCNPVRQLIPQDGVYTINADGRRQARNYALGDVSRVPVERGPDVVGDPNKIRRQYLRRGICSPGDEDQDEDDDAFDREPYDEKPSGQDSTKDFSRAGYKITKVNAKNKMSKISCNPCSPNEDCGPCGPDPCDPY